ncbi:MAG: two-component system sensor histidine kinase NtrB [Acidimicrobiales bacterium]
MLKSTTPRAVVILFVLVAIVGRLVVVIVAGDEIHEPFVLGRVLWVLVLIPIAVLAFDQRRIETASILLAVSALVFATVLLVRSGNVAGEPFVLLVAATVGAGVISGAKGAVAVGSLGTATIMVAAAALATGLVPRRDFIADATIPAATSYAVGLATITALLYLTTKASDLLFVELKAVNSKLEEELERRGRTSGALLESQAELEATLMNAPLGILTADLNGRIVRSNQALADLVHTSGAGLTSSTIYSIIDPADLDRFIQRLDDVVAGNNDHEPFTVSILRRDRSTVDGEIHFGLVESSARQSQVVLIIKDLTERRGFEQRLAADQRHQHTSAMASGVAHDFNNLMTAVLAQGAVASKRHELGLPVAEQLETMKVGARTAASLTRQLMAYSGQLHLEPELLSLNEVIEQFRELLNVALPSGVSLRLELGTQVPLVRADLGQIQQLLLNLTLNAATSYRNEPGTILLKTTSLELDEGDLDSWPLGTDSPSAGRYALLEVTDHGSGMDAATSSRAFDPFFTTEAEGRGLGLAVVLGIVRSHRGAVRLHTAPGDGTTVEILVPAA